MTEQIPPYEHYKAPGAFVAWLMMEDVSNEAHIYRATEGLLRDQGAAPAPFDVIERMVAEAGLVMLGYIGPGRVWWDPEMLDPLWMLQPIPIAAFLSDCAHYAVPIHRLRIHVRDAATKTIRIHEAFFGNPADLERFELFALGWRIAYEKRGRN